MRVPFDSAMFAVGGWLQSYDTLSHPTSAGIGDEQNEFGIVIGASVEAHWPAQPLLIGRWGWADEGDPTNSDAAMLGNDRYDPGERLGDVILAAEQRLGAGKVICFGDTSSFSNGLMPGCHLYTSRLFAYLASDVDTPFALWRQLAGLVGALVLLALLLWYPSPTRLAAAGLVLAGLIVLCTEWTYRAWEVLPDGAVKSPNNLAYINDVHLGAYSPETWREDGLGGLMLTLTRNGYLPLQLPEYTRERLSRARLLMLVAPAREFSPREQQLVDDFVRSGGILICTVGYERSGPSRSLLAGLGFHFHPPDQGDPRAAAPAGAFQGPVFQWRRLLRLCPLPRGLPHLVR